MISEPEENTITSPTLSAVSFISSSWQQKSPSELIPILKSYYKKLKRKDNDLKMAAHYGNSLLEDNIALKSSYDQLLQNAPYPTPTQSTSLISLDEGEDEEWLEYVEPARTREALVEILERQNKDLQNQLEQALSNQEDLDRAHQLKSKQLQDELDHLHQQLEGATIQIQEMEENRKPRKTLTKDSSTNVPTCCAEINEKMKQLRSDHDHLSQAKVQVDKRLNEAVHQIGALRQQYEITSQDHDNLQRAFDRQHSHLNELTATLEEYRARLRDNSTQDTASSFASSSLYTEDYDNQNSISLLTELNMATSRVDGNTDINMFQNCVQPNVDSTIESIYNKVDIVDNDLLDDALSMIGRLANEYNHTRFMQQKRHLRYNGQYDQGVDEEVQVQKEEPLKYPSLDKYKVEEATTVKQEETRNVCILLLLWISNLVRFYLVVAIASIVSFQKGPEFAYSSSI